MSIDRLAAELRAAGTAAGEGGFSLDRERAREKLRQFQLADPHRWVVLVVQAVVARGATAIMIEIDADDVHIRADGAPLTKEDFDELYSSMWATGEHRPGLRELALATNAVMALNPRYLRVDSGDGRQGMRLELRVGAADRIEPVATPPVGTHVHAKERFRPGLLVRFMRSRDGALPEQAILRERCEWADVAIVLGEQRLSVGVGAMLPDATPISAGSLRGALAFDPAGDVGVLFVVRLGVLLTQHALPHPLFAGARAVLVADRLCTDASMSDIVRDAEYDAFIAALGHAHDGEVARRLAAFVSGASALPPVWMPIVRERIAGWLETTPAVADNPAYAQWFAVPLWRTVGNEPRSTAQIAELVPQIRISKEAPPAEVPKNVAMVLHVTTEDDRDALRRMFGKKRIVDATSTVKRAITRLANHEAWRRRPHAARLPDERAYSARTPIVGDGITGEVGLCDESMQRSFVRLVVEGCMLVELPAELGLPTVHAVIDGRFHPNHMYDGVARDGKLAAAMIAVMAAVDVLARGLAETALSAAVLAEPMERVLANHLIAQITDELDAAALVSVGFEAKAAAKHVAAAERPWRFDRARDLSPSSTHPFARMPIFADAAGDPITLTEVADEVAREGAIRVIGMGRPTLRKPPRFVVRAGERKLALLKALFGEDAVQLAGAEFERWHAREARCERVPARALEVPECAFGPVPFTDGARRGIVGLLAGEITGTDRHASVRVYVDDRPLAEVEIECGISGVAIAIDVEPDLADAKLDSLPDEAALAKLAASASVGVAALLQAILAPASVASLGTAERLPVLALEIGALAWPFPLVRAWAALRGELGDAAGDAAHCELLELLDTHEAYAVMGSIGDRLRESVVPLPQLVAGEIAALASAAKIPWGPARLAAVAQLPWLLAAPWLPTASGTCLSIQHIVDAAVAERHVRYEAQVGPEAHVEGFDDVLALPRRGFSPLLDIVGPQRLEDAHAQLDTARRRRKLEQRSELSALVVDRHRVLVSFKVDEHGMKGELGIPPRLPGAGQGSIVVCHGKRPIQTIEPEGGLPWFGTIGGEFGHDTGFETLSGADRGRVIELCKRQGAPALRAVVQRWREVPIEARACLRTWALHLLSRVAPLTRGEPVLLAERGIAELSTFPIAVDTSGQERTLDELHVDWRAHGDLVYARHGMVGDRLVVAMERGADVEALRKVFGEVRDYAAEVSRQASLAARLCAAAPLPTAPSDALAMYPVDGRGLVGLLWLTADVTDETEVMFGRDGRVVGGQRVSSMFPCHGAITGPGLDIADDWSGFELSTPQQNELKNEACSLWESLVQAAAKAEAIDEPRARLLRSLLLRLHAIPTARRSWPNHDQRKLYRELRKLALLPMSSGHAIALEVALRERPAELDRLGLWDPREREIQDEAARADEPKVPAELSPPVEAPPVPVVAAPIDPADRLLAAVRDELRLVRAHAQDLLAEIHLERMTIRELDGRAIAHWVDDALVLDRASPLVARGLAEPDVLVVAILASATFTALNCALEDVTDAHELDFLRWHAAHARTATRDT